MSQRKRKIPPKKSKTVRVLVPRSDNPRAQRAYLVIIGIMLWASGLGFLLVIYGLYEESIGIDPIVAALFVTIFASFAIGMYGILKVKPPLHYFVHFGAVINLIISFFAGAFGYLLGIGSILLLYIGLRFPIRFEWEKRRLTKDGQIPQI
ncbi:MAG: hypothetical protein ACW99A_22660 [Candidatus Kariarchaeaceae archaeon]